MGKQSGRRRRPGHGVDRAQTQSSVINHFRSLVDHEVDFLLPETRQLIQVTQSLAAPAAREQEVRALVEAMQTLGVT